ncbi:hypothetical protein D3C72_1902130 [compost metagenome]
MASASAIASSMAMRVPEPIEKCALVSASPISTWLPTCQVSLTITGNWRHTELLDTSR